MSQKADENLTPKWKSWVSPMASSAFVVCVFGLASLHSTLLALALVALIAVVGVFLLRFL
tara:strand:- start:28 stop:207 length:180 start_codon:yes stop_codon:yes gene_type:complete